MKHKDPRFPMWWQNEKRVLENNGVDDEVIERCRPWYAGGTFITNFRKNEEATISQAIKASGAKLHIEEYAYDVWGNAFDTHFSLHHNAPPESGDLSHFWAVYREFLSEEEK